MELDDNAKSAARELGDAINAAIGSSAEVADAIEYLRSIGYEPQLSVRLEKALLRPDTEADLDDECALSLTEDDVKTLRRMKILSD